MDVLKPLCSLSNHPLFDDIRNAFLKYSEKMNSSGGRCRSQEVMRDTQLINSIIVWCLCTTPDIGKVIGETKLLLLI